MHIREEYKEWRVTFNFDWTTLFFSDIFLLQERRDVPTHKLLFLTRQLIQMPHIFINVRANICQHTAASYMSNASKT